MKLQTILAALALILAPLAARADTPLSNIGVPNSGFSQIVTGDPGNPDTYVAQSFITGTSGLGQWNFQNVVLALDQTEAGTTPPFQVAIYSDNAGSPGSSLAALSGSDDPGESGAGTYTYTDSTGLLLDDSTQYWIVASAVDSTTFASGYTWNVIDDGTGTTFTTQDSGWTVNPSDLLAVSPDGLSWENFDADEVGGNLEFSVNTGTVPEPASWSSLLLGAGLLGWALRRRKGSTSGAPSFGSKARGACGG